MKKIHLFYFTMWLFLLSCNIQKEESISPKEVFSKFANAISAKDYYTAQKYATKESAIAIGIMKMAMNKTNDNSMLQPFDTTTYDFGQPIILDNNAKIPLTDKETRVVISFPLKKEEGNWKVAFDANSVMDMISNTEDNTKLDELVKPNNDQYKKDIDSLLILINESKNIMKEISPK